MEKKIIINLSLGANVARKFDLANSAKIDWSKQCDFFVYENILISLNML